MHTKYQGKAKNDNLWFKKKKLSFFFLYSKKSERNSDKDRNDRNTISHLFLFWITVAKTVVYYKFLSLSFNLKKIEE